jgi:hypothetical protein
MEIAMNRPNDYLSRPRARRGFTLTELLVVIMPPNSWSCGTGQTDGAYTVSSRHTGIVNVLTADGSTRAVKQTIAVQTWWALGTRSGGEAISAEAY